MSKKVRIIISCLFVVLAFGAGIFAYAHTHGNGEDTANAVTMPTDYFVNASGVIVIPDGPNEGSVDTRGTAGNPFFILEIVPYDGMAQIGFLIDGQEPLDVHAMARDGQAIPGESQFYKVTDDHVVFSYWKGKQPETFLEYTTLKVNQYGVMTRVEDGFGDYKCVETKDEAGNVTAVNFVEDFNGNFEWTPLSLEECIALGDDGETEYNEINNEAENLGDQVKVYFEDVEYVTRVGKTIEHNDVFLRESVGLAYEYDENGIRHRITDETVIDARVAAYETVVYTVTPEDLNLNLGLIDRADMIVISSQSTMLETPAGGSVAAMLVEVADGESEYDTSSGTKKLKTKYRYYPYIRKDKIGYEDPDGQYGRVKNVYGATFSTNPLSWEAVVKIYENSTNPNSICPIVADFKMYKDTKTDNTKSVTYRRMSSNGTTKDVSVTGTQNNLAKLFLLNYQMTNPVFEAFYGELSAVDGMFESVPMADGSTNKDGSVLTTGKFNYDKDWTSAQKNHLDQDSKTYWDASTLLPWRVVQNSNHLTSLSDYSAAMATYQVMVDSGTPYNMTAYTNTIRNGFLITNGDSKLDTAFDWQNCGMPDNQYGYEVYDYFESINGYRTSASPSLTPEEGALTMADCINYLLGGSHGGASIDNKVYKVLELQPSPDYEDEQWFWKPLIAAHTNSIADPVIETMTTSEFIGARVECMGAYDLIYVGINKFSGSDDPAMNFSGTDFIYAHTGPEGTISDSYKAMYGWLGTTQKEKENKFVYSGNDLTELALNKLKEYGAEGFPILFGSGFYDSTGVSSVISTVDRNSHIYTLGKTASNRMNYDALSTVAGSRQLRNILTINSRKVDFYFASESDYPVLYDTSKPVEERYINGTTISNHTLKFTFKVLGPEGSKYRVKLYVDSNTDGMYKKGQEDLGVTVRKKSDNTLVSNGVVEAGGTYVVTRTINDRIGSICWKLDLVENNSNEKKVYASFSGVSAIKEDPSDPDDNDDILVLQIVPKDRPATLMLPLNAADAAANGEASKMFYDKIGGDSPSGLNGMKITFERKTQDQIWAAMKGTGTDADPENPNYLYETYDMLVLGFSDMYDGVSNEKVIQAIQAFIANGKAVLYTHDTTSFTGPSGGSFSSWGKTLTQTIREAYGMDRYGALNMITPGSVTTTIDTPYKPSSGGTGQVYKNSDNKALVQGYTNGTLWRALGTGGSNLIAKEVSRVNIGAITEYPYNIPEKIKVNDTHPQYYQLDMEEDDMVVWYCLSEGNGSHDFYKASPNDVRNNYYIYNKGNVTYSGMGHSMDLSTAQKRADFEQEIELFVNTFIAAYRAAAKRVAVQVVNDDVTVNAAGEQFLCVDVDSSDADEIIGKDISDSYHLQTFDWSDNKGYVEGAEESKKSKRVYFKLVDTNSYGGATYDVKIVLNDGTELDGIQINGEKDDPTKDDDDHNKMLAVYDKATGTFVDNDAILKYRAEDTAIYYVDIPIITEEGEVGDGKRIVTTTKAKISVTMKYSMGDMELSVVGHDQVYIMPRGLFDLD